MKKEKTEISARLPFAVSMLIFGTIGLLRRFIELPSGVIACFRGLLGCVLLLLLQRLRGKKRLPFPHERGRKKTSAHISRL